MKDASTTITILVVFASDDQLKTIKYIHINLVVCHTGCQLYEPKFIPWFVQLIEEDLKKAMEKQTASGSSVLHVSFKLWVLDSCAH